MQTYKNEHGVEFDLKIDFDNMPILTQKKIKLIYWKVFNEIVLVKEMSRIPNNGYVVRSKFVSEKKDEEIIENLNDKKDALATEIMEDLELDSKPTLNYPSMIAHE
eukprot:UN25739